MKKNGATDIRTATVPSNAQIAWTAEVRPSAGDATNLPPPAPLIGRMSIGGPGAAAFGDPAANGLPAPGRNGAAYTTAALTDGDNPPSENGGADVTTQDVMPPSVAPPAPRPAKASKPTRRDGSRTRSVQQLFMHPLGRM
jgi:hypothetical protein